MSRLDDLGEILDGYEGREYKSDIVLCKNMLFVLGELDLGSLPASEQLYQQILDGTFDIAYKNDDTIKYCGINYTKDHNEQGERKWGWLTRNDAISQVYTNKFEKYAASRVSHSSLYETIKSAEGKAAVLLLMNDKLPIENNICPILEEAEKNRNKIGVIHIGESKSKVNTDFFDIADVFYATPKSNVRALMRAYGDYVLQGKEKPFPYHALKAAK